MPTRFGPRGALFHMLAAFALMACQAAAAPTPQIIYVTAPPQPSQAAPTPIVIYVTPEPLPSGTVHPLTGTFSLHGSQNWSTNTRVAGGPTTCHGGGGYSDVQVGMKLIVKDQAGAVIATGETEMDPTWKIAEQDCRYVFAVTVPDAPFYSIEAGRRGALTYSRADLDAAGWHVDLTLGS